VFRRNISRWKYYDVNPVHTILLVIIPKSALIFAPEFVEVIIVINVNFYCIRMKTRACYMISSIKEDSINLIQTQYQSNCYMWTAFYVYVITVTIILYDTKLVRMADKVTGFWVKKD